jgi:hypothetical protein
VKQVAEAKPEARSEVKPDAKSGAKPRPAKVSG